MNGQKIRTIIVEDELFDRQLIEHILTTNYLSLIDLVDSVSRIEDAVISIREKQPQLVFLDIEINGDRNGAYNLLEQVENNFKIIFVTAKSEQDDLLRAIRLSCIDYLIKPTKISDFETPINKVYSELNSSMDSSMHRIEVLKHNMDVSNLQESRISLQEGFSYRPTYIKDIIRCEAEGNYTRITFSNNTNSLINGNLKSFEEKLSSYGFCRISKSDLINLAHIKTFSRKNISWEVITSDNKTLFISTQRKQSFLLFYNSYHLS